MSWDESYVRAQVKNEWDGSLQFWVLPYHTKRSGYADAVSEFIWKFKDGRDDAVQLAIQLLAEAIAQQEMTIRNRYRCTAICCVPSSQKGKPSATTERVCRELAWKLRWLTHFPGALERTETVPRAHLCRPGERPSLQKHLDTMACCSNYNLNGKSVLLFDDILTSGSTSDAAVLKLQSEKHCNKVVRLFLGKTQ